MLTLGFENDHTVAMTVSKKYRGLAIDVHLDAPLREGEALAVRLHALRAAAAGRVDAVLTGPAGSVRRF